LSNPKSLYLKLPDISSISFERIFVYLQFHQQPNLDEKTIIQFDNRFVQVQQMTLCEIASLGYYLDIKSLVNISSKAIANYISGKTLEDMKSLVSNNDSGSNNRYNNSSVRNRLQQKLNAKKLQNQQN